jgi:hypothetical protein
MIEVGLDITVMASADKSLHETSQKGRGPVVLNYTESVLLKKAPLNIVEAPGGPLLRPAVHWRRL